MGAQDLVPPSNSEAGGPAKSGAGKRCRNSAAVAVRAFLDLLEESSSEGVVTIDTARRIANAIMSAGGPLSTHYVRAEAECDAAFALIRVEKQRVDLFGRLITQPFAHLLREERTGIERKHLPQFFAAVRMMLGEEIHDDLKARCVAVAEHHRTEEGPVAWDAFYADPDAQTVLEHVLVTIARSFRRFEPRKDWFLIVMNSNPSTISLGSNVFVAKKPEDKAVREFSEPNLCRLFKALFAQMRPEHFEAPRRKAFVEKWGSEPDKIFGNVFVELEMLGQQCGVTG